MADLVEHTEEESLPAGIVTFLFTDIQGSTPLWERDRILPGQATLCLACGTPPDGSNSRIKTASPLGRLGQARTADGVSRFMKTNHQANLVMEN